jgi:polysaccharide biosynthesis protein PslH
MNIAIVHPYPVHRNAAGGVTRVNSLVRHLAGRHRVTVFAHSSGDAALDRTAVDDLREAGVEQHLFPRPVPSIVERTRWVASRTPYFVHRNRSARLETALVAFDREQAFDVVHVEFAYLWPVIARAAGDGPVRFVAEQEMMSVALERLRGVPGRSLYERYVSTQIAKVRRFEAEVLPRFDRVFGITSAEAARLSAMAGRPCPVLPHVVCTRMFHPGRVSPEPATVLFVGNYSHRPNLHALRWLVDRIWPAVRTQRPDARLVAVGPGLAGSEVTRLVEAGVTVAGRVDDLVRAYQRAALFVNPITSGGGMRGKVLEAFACALPVVSTPMGMEGVAAQNGRHYVAGSTAEEFARAIVAYLQDPAMADRHGRAARELVVAQYDIGVVFSALEAAYGEAVTECRARRARAIA